MPRPKDRWDKLEIILKPIGGLSAAFAVGILGFTTSSYLSKKEARETRIQLYTQLMTQREASESELRKDMFATIIESFFQRTSKSLDDQVLNVELLAYNFHESLNLKPLFVDLSEKIVKSDESLETKAAYIHRLERVAREVTRKQLMVLDSAGRSYERTVDRAALAASPAGIPLEPASLELEGVERDFRIFALKADEATREIKLRLEVDTKGVEKTRYTEFWLNFYDFPMIDNTRLLRDQRVAVVMNHFDAYSIDITVAYFPGAYASLTEKPYFNEALQQLMQGPSKK